MTPGQPIGMGLDGGDLVIALTGLSVFLLGVALIYGVFRRDRLGPRIDAVVGRGESRGTGAAVARSRHQARGLEIMRWVVQSLRLMRGRQAARVKESLAHAGYRSKDAVIVYLFSKLALPAVALGLAFIMLYEVRPIELPAIANILACLMAGLVGSYVPDAVVRRATKKRRHSISKALPDALDLMVICAEAGYSLDAALRRVAQEIRVSSPELADELGLTTFELGFAADRGQSLDNLSARVGLPGIQSLAATLKQTEKLGTPLANALRVLSAELRDERMLRAEEKASRLPAIMTVPLIVFVLPALFVVVLGPAVLQIVDMFGKM